MKVIGSTGKTGDKSPLEVLGDETYHTSHVALEDTTWVDLGCDDLSNDSVERSRSAASDCNSSSRSFNLVREYPIQPGFSGPRHLRDDVQILQLIRVNLEHRYARLSNEVPHAVRGS